MKKHEEYTEEEKLVSRLTGIKGLVARSHESTDVSSEILTLCDDGVMGDIVQKCIDTIESLSRENLEISAKLESPLCRVCQKLVFPTQEGFQSVVGIIHTSCREGLKEIMEMKQ